MAKKEKNKTDAIKNKPTCGIIMPISAIDGCSSEHWGEVKDILSEAICDAGYYPNLVSNADDIGIIQKRIIQNLYNNDIVVCDVSGKNPNVMFELGMRLAFDKPAIIVIDDKTDYSFDTSPIEHLHYYRDLRYFNILIFKEQLSKKIKATVEKAKNDSTYTTFLKNFGEFEVAHVEKTEGSINDVMLAKIDDLSQQINQISNYYSSNTIVPRRILYEDDIFIDNEITRLVKLSIEKYIKVHGISIVDLIKNLNNERYDLKLFLEKNKTLQFLCRQPQKLDEAINDAITSLV